MINNSTQAIFKFCPRCGSSSFNYKKGDYFHCSTCNFVYYVNSATAVAAIIVNEKGEILLTKRALNPGKGMLDLPGGFVDIGEKIEDAMYREIKEELNLNISSMKYLCSYPNKYLYSDLIVNTCDCAFVCNVDNIEDIIAGDDVDDFSFFSKEKIDFNDIFSESISNIIKNYFDF
ncbi:MAG: NUDIX domain-containing protein [Marinifilaceae bacterium]|jgi:NADH pyrophosphatase NudC (nudix superfamily)|nr:NUDIX domain-containing protein [Marinifilaceae bacterium]